MPYQRYLRCSQRQRGQRLHLHPQTPVPGLCASTRQQRDSRAVRSLHMPENVTKYLYIKQSKLPHWLGPHTKHNPAANELLRLEPELERSVADGLERLHLATDSLLHQGVLEHQ